MEIQSTPPSFYWYCFEPTFSVSPCLRYFVESQLPAGYKDGGRPSPAWALNYSFTPYGKYRVGDNSQWRLRNAFEAHVYPQGMRFYEDTECNTENGRIRSIYLTFTNGEDAGLLPMTLPAGYARFIDPSQKMGTLLERMLHVIRELEGKGFWIAQGILCEIFMLLHHSIRIDTETFVIPEASVTSHHTDFVRLVRAYLLSHIGDDITQEELARHFNLSVSYFYHRYRQEAGEAPTATLQKMRVDLAKTLLLKGYRMRNIASQTGFCDEFHLSKVFKRIEGMSPSVFRKQHNDEIEDQLDTDCSF